MQDYAQFLADAARILEIVCGSAVGVVIVLPVGHEQPLHGIAAALQQECCDGRVDAARHADHDGAGELGIGERRQGIGGRKHPPIIRAPRSNAGAEPRAKGYMSICRICDSCMLVCQTSSKKFK
jgi:hypothetical protein